MLAQRRADGSGSWASPRPPQVVKSVGGVSTSYLYDRANIVQELSGPTPTANLLVAAIDEVLARTDGTGTVSYLADALGSTIALANGSGLVLTEYTYEPF